MVTFRFLYHTMFLVCVFSVRLKISIRIRTDAVSSFNSLRILPLMLSGPQVLCVLVLCRSFFTPGRDIGSAVFMMWVLVQSGMLSCDSTVNTDWHCWGCWIFALCQLWSVHRSSLVWHLFCLYLRILYITASFITYCLRFWPRYSFSGTWFMSSDAEKLTI